MNRRLLAALIGLGAGVLLAGAYVALLYARVPLRPEWVVGGAAAIVFAGAVAVFALVAMDRPSYGGIRPTFPLNEEPATRFIFPFKGGDLLQIVARADMSVGEMLVRFGDAFKTPAENMTKPISLTIKGSAKKPFSTITLEQLFLALKPFNLQHVVLVNDKDDFVGYIPGRRALKEFAGDKPEEKITKFIVKVLADPSAGGVLRDIGGITRDDTINETDTARDAEGKVWANDNVHGLVVHRHLKPIGVISKVDVLRVNAGRP